MERQNTKTAMDDPFALIVFTIISLAFGVGPLLWTLHAFPEKLGAIRIAQRRCVDFFGMAVVWLIYFVRYGLARRQK